MVVGVGGCRCGWVWEQVCVGGGGFLGGSEWNARVY